MSISIERVQADLAAIAQFTMTPGAGITRPAFSPAWRRVRDYIVGQLESIGCKVRIDAAGNLHARPSAISFDAPAWLSGSHIDTVPNGGNYDGITGIVAALEALRAAREDLKIAVPMELIAWACNEATTFGIGMIGSRALVGDLSPEQLDGARNSDGSSYLEAGAGHGVAAERLVADKLRAHTVIGHIEIHTEEAPGLWNQRIIAAGVSEMAGRRQYHCTITGQSSHASSTSMDDRRDALAGAADAILTLEKIANDIGGHTRITVGHIECQPNSTNRVVGQAAFTIDVRCPKLQMLASADQSIRKNLARLADSRQLSLKLDLTESHAAVEMDARILGKMRRSAATWHIEPYGQTTSGAMHDAGILAPYVPAAMLLVPSRDGIGHDPAEFARKEDIAAAATILLETVRDRRIE